MDKNKIYSDVLYNEDFECNGFNGVIKTSTGGLALGLVVIPDYHKLYKLDTEKLRGFGIYVEYADFLDDNYVIGSSYIHCDNVNKKLEKGNNFIKEEIKNLVKKIEAVT